MSTVTNELIQLATLRIKQSAAKGKHRDKPDPPPNLRLSDAGVAKCASCKHYTGSLLDSTCDKYKWPVQPDLLCDSYEPEGFDAPPEVAPAMGDWTPYMTGMNLPGIPPVPKMAMHKRADDGGGGGGGGSGSSSSGGSDSSGSVTQGTVGGGTYTPSDIHRLQVGYASPSGKKKHKKLSKEAMKAAAYKAATAASVSSGPAQPNAASGAAFSPPQPLTPPAGAAQGQQPAGPPPAPPPAMGGFKPSVTGADPAAASRMDVQAALQASGTGVDPQAQAMAQPQPSSDPSMGGGMGMAPKTAGSGVRTRDKLGFMMSSGRAADPMVVASIYELQSMPGVDVLSRLDAVMGTLDLSSHSKRASAVRTGTSKAAGAHHNGGAGSLGAEELKGHEPPERYNLLHRPGLHHQMMEAQGQLTYLNKSALYAGESLSRSSGTPSARPRPMGQTALSGTVPMRQQVPADAQHHGSDVLPMTKGSAQHTHRLPVELSNSLLKHSSSRGTQSNGTHELTPARGSAPWTQRAEKRARTAMPGSPPIPTTTAVGPASPMAKTPAQLPTIAGKPATPAPPPTAPSISPMAMGSGKNSITPKMAAHRAQGARGQGPRELLLASATLAKTGVAPTPQELWRDPRGTHFTVGRNEENSFSEHITQLTKAAVSYKQAKVPSGSTRAGGKAGPVPGPSTGGMPTNYNEIMAGPKPVWTPPAAAGGDSPQLTPGNNLKAMPAALKNPLAAGFPSLEGSVSPGHQIDPYLAKFLVPSTKKPSPAQSMLAAPGAEKRPAPKAPQPKLPMTAAERMDLSGINQMKPADTPVEQPLSSVDLKEYGLKRKAGLSHAEALKPTPAAPAVPPAIAAAAKEVAAPAPVAPADTPWQPGMEAPPVRRGINPYQPLPPGTMGHVPGTYPVAETAMKQRAERAARSAARQDKAKAPLIMLRDEAPAGAPAAKEPTAPLTPAPAAAPAAPAAAAETPPPAVVAATHEQVAALPPAEQAAVQQAVEEGRLPSWVIPGAIGMGLGALGASLLSGGDKKEEREKYGLDQDLVKAAKSLVGFGRPLSSQKNMLGRNSPSGELPPPPGGQAPEGPAPQPTAVAVAPFQSGKGLGPKMAFVGMPYADTGVPVGGNTKSLNMKPLKKAVPIGGGSRQGMPGMPERGPLPADGQPKLAGAILKKAFEEPDFRLPQVANMTSTTPGRVQAQLAGGAVGYPGGAHHELLNNRLMGANVPSGRPGAGTQIQPRALVPGGAQMNSQTAPRPGATITTQPRSPMPSGPQTMPTTVSRPPTGGSSIASAPMPIRQNTPLRSQQTSQVKPLARPKKSFGIGSTLSGSELETDKTGADKHAYEDHSKTNTLKRKPVSKNQLPMHPQPDPHEGSAVTTTAKHGSWVDSLFKESSFGIKEDPYRDRRLERIPSYRSQGIDDMLPARDYTRSSAPLADTGETARNAAAAESLKQRQAEFAAQLAAKNQAEAQHQVTVNPYVAERIAKGQADSLRAKATNAARKAAVPPKMAGYKEAIGEPHRVHFAAPGSLSKGPFSMGDRFNRDRSDMGDFMKAGVIDLALAAASRHVFDIVKSADFGATARTARGMLNAPRGQAPAAAAVPGEPNFDPRRGARMTSRPVAAPAAGMGTQVQLPDQARATIMGKGIHSGTYSSPATPNDYKIHGMTQQIDQLKGDYQTKLQQYNEMRQTNPQQAQQLYQQLRQSYAQYSQLSTQRARLGNTNPDMRAAYAEGAKGVSNAQGPRTISPEQQAALDKGDVRGYREAGAAQERQQQMGQPGYDELIKKQQMQGIHGAVDPQGKLGPRPELNRDLAKTNPQEYMRQQQAIRQWDANMKQQQDVTTGRAPAPVGEGKGGAPPGEQAGQVKGPGGGDPRGYEFNGPNGAPRDAGDWKGPGDPWKRGPDGRPAEDANKEWIKADPPGGVKGGAPPEEMAGEGKGEGDMNVAPNPAPAAPAPAPRLPQAPPRPIGGTPVAGQPRPMAGPAGNRQQNRINAGGGRPAPAGQPGGKPGGAAGNKPAPAGGGNPPPAP